MNKYLAILGAMVLAGCGNNPLPPKTVKESRIEAVITAPCLSEFVDLQGNFLGTADEGETRYSAPVPSGQIRIEYHYAKFSEELKEPRRAGFWKASNSCSARAIIKALDSFESLPGDVATYRTKGRYPYYKEELVKGGCDHGELNCSD